MLCFMASILSPRCGKSRSTARSLSCGRRWMASCSIGHAVLLNLVRDSIGDPLLLDLVAQYLHRTVDENCLYSTVTIGISLGCPLSPVMAALYVEPLDRRMEATGLTYARFHRRMERGFAFLGYWITQKGVTGVAPSAWQGFQERVARLYEQDTPPEEARRRIEQYVRRWKRWVLSGLGGGTQPWHVPDGVGGIRPLPSGLRRWGDLPVAPVGPWRGSGEILGDRHEMPVEPHTEIGTGIGRR
jgi:hypothetical protein